MTAMLMPRWMRDMNQTHASLPNLPTYPLARTIIPLRYVERRWRSISCDCGEAACSGETTERYYVTPDGTPKGAEVKLQPGDVYVVGCHGPCTYGWENCLGWHLYVVCPDGDSYHPWCVDGRASNCSMREDKTHRCWIRKGDPKLPMDHPQSLTVSKRGQTCRAGGGSIMIGTYHAMLERGALRPCGDSR